MKDRLTANACLLLLFCFVFSQSNVLGSWLLSDSHIKTLCFEEAYKMLFYLNP